MKYKDYIEKVSADLEFSHPLTGDEVLEEMDEWDSLKLLSFIAFVDREFGCQLKMTDVVNCRTLRDLYALLPA